MKPTHLGFLVLCTSELSCWETSVSSASSCCCSSFTPPPRSGHLWVGSYMTRRDSYSCRRRCNTLSPRGRPGPAGGTGSGPSTTGSPPGRCRCGSWPRCSRRCPWSGDGSRSASTATCPRSYSPGWGGGGGFTLLIWSVCNITFSTSCAI